MLILLTGLMAIAQADWPWVGDAQPPSHAFPANGPLAIDSRWNGVPTRVRLTQGPVPHCGAASAWLKGAAADRQDRCTHLTRLDVVVGRKSLPMDRKAYLDLGCVQQVVVRFTPAQAIVYLLGPDGYGVYYGAILRISEDGTVHRRVQLDDDSVERRRFAPRPDPQAAGRSQLRFRNGSRSPASDHDRNTVGDQAG